MVKKVKALMLLSMLALFASAALASSEIVGPDCPGSGQWCAVDPSGNWYVKGADAN
ncbi:MAG TPA: hypothetical protein VHC97_20185 [Thermoanaerobaculia bacterium]|jgi:hypothetical protein|nr:hypothetical protein [Thermoanaerobaculia bacterium]